MQTNAFPGFTRELQGFFYALPMHNNLTDQAENVANYRALAYEPLQKLYDDLLPTIWEISEELETRPRRCVSSPYTDRRFYPTTPIKEYLYLHFQQIGPELDVPGLFFDLGAEGYIYGLRMYHTTTKGMTALRERILPEADAYDRALGVLLDAGFSMYGEAYKRDHYPDRPDAPSKLLLNSRRICVAIQRPFDDRIASPAFADELKDAFRLAGPLWRLLAQAEY